MKTLVIAPHPDDELLGCGGTLLRRKAEGAEIGWVIVTGISVQAGWDAARVARRDAEIAAVTRAVGFDAVFNLGFPTTRLDEVPLGDLVGRLSDAFQKFEPVEVLLPNRGDAHSDHRTVFDAAVACTKWFRYPTVRRVLAYETLSETDFGLSPGDSFQPNYFVDITTHLEAKLAALKLYESEMHEFPFPRSVAALRALAAIRGAASGFMAAEAFQLLRERG